MSQILHTGIAGADLSAYRGYAVRADGADTERVVLADDSTDTETIGILVGPGTDESAVEVCIFGVCEARSVGPSSPTTSSWPTPTECSSKHTGADAIAIARYLAPVKEANGTLSQPDSADGRGPGVRLRQPDPQPVRVTPQQHVMGGLAPRVRRSPMTTPLQITTADVDFTAVGRPGTRPTSATSSSARSPRSRGLGFEGTATPASRPTTSWTSATR